MSTLNVTDTFRAMFIETIKKALEYKTEIKLSKQYADGSYYITVYQNGDISMKEYALNVYQELEDTNKAFTLDDLLFEDLSLLTENAAKFIDNLG